jgi:hypothetical protein
MGRLYRRGEEVPLWAEGISWEAYERWLWEMPRERIEDRIARRDWEKKREAEAEKAAKMATRKARR